MTRLYPPLSRNTDPVTSHKAADRAKRFAWDHKAAILGVMWRPMIAPEIGRLTRLTTEQICRRLPELQAAGLVRLTGREREDGGSSFREWEKVLDKQSQAGLF